MFMNEQKKTCPICDFDLPSDFYVRSAIVSTETPRWVDKTEPVEVCCPACGDFYISIQMIDYHFSVEEKVKLKYYYATLSGDDKMRRFDNYIKDPADKDKILSSINAPKTLLEKIHYTLLYIGKHTTFYGDTVEFIGNELHYRLLFCKNYRELFSILSCLKDNDYISSDTIDSIYVYESGKNISRRDKVILTLKGLEKIEKLENRIDSKQCFVAMWFNNQTKSLYNKIEAAVEGDSNVNKSSEAYGAGYKCFKIDDKLHANYIPPEIIAEIKRSKFVIADLTGYRGGVYYEAGFAEGLGIPVIYTCNKDWFEDKKIKRSGKEKITQNGVHFDLKQKNIIIWEDDKLEEFQRTLVSTIGAIVGFNN